MGLMTSLFPGLFSKWHFAAAVLFAVLFTIATPHHAYAATASQCTDDGGDDFDPASLTIFQDIAQNVTSRLNSLSQTMFQDVAGYLEGFIEKLCYLYILIYGFLFMFGAAQTSLYDAVARAAKIFVVSSVLNDPGHVLSLMNQVFDQGADEIINSIIASMYGGGGGSSPLSSIDDLLSTIASPKTLVTIEALASTGFYGFMFFFVVLNSLKSIGEAVVNALWVYLMSKVVRCLLIGVSPVFIPCFLFKGTRQFFQGWLNELVNTALQPILLFSFFTFFVITIENVVNTIIDEHPVCLDTMPDTGRSAPVDTKWWRFKDSDDNRGAVWGPVGSNKLNDDTDESKPFPINVYSVIVLFVLAELGTRLNSIVLAIAAGIAGASTNFGDMSGFMANMAPPPGGPGSNKLAGGGDDPPKPGSTGGGSDPSRTSEGVKKQISDSIGNREDRALV